MSSVHWSPGMRLEDVERLAILAAMRFYEDNKTQTAKSLDISVRTLHAKLDKYEELNLGIRTKSTKKQ